MKIRTLGGLLVLAPALSLLGDTPQGKPKSDPQNACTSCKERRQTLDPKTFESCLADPKTKQKVDADLAAARGAGISGTPGFVVNGRLLSGAQPAENFFEVIDAELAKAPAPAAGPS